MPQQHLQAKTEASYQAPASCKSPCSSQLLQSTGITRTNGSLWPYQPVPHQLLELLCYWLILVPSACQTLLSSSQFTACHSGFSQTGVVCLCCHAKCCFQELSQRLDMAALPLGCPDLTQDSFCLGAVLKAASKIPCAVIAGLVLIHGKNLTSSHQTWVLTCVCFCFHPCCIHAQVWILSNPSKTSGTNSC